MAVQSLAAMSRVSAMEGCCFAIGLAISMGIAQVMKI